MKNDTFKGLVESETELVGGTVKSLIRNIVVQEVKIGVLGNRVANIGSLDGQSQAQKTASDVSDEGNENKKYSLFGKPVWDVIEFRYTTPGESTIFCVLPIALIEVTNTRNVVTTAVAGLDGTIKEYISDGDYIINIKAKIVGSVADEYPAEDGITGSGIKSINKILSVKDSVVVTSKILNTYFGINEVVITNVNFRQAGEGQRNVQEVELNCLSNNPDLYKIILLY